MNTDHASDLSSKHRQSLLSAYNRVKKLCRRFDDSLYLSVPSELRSVRKALEKVLAESGVIEYHYTCTQCGHAVWSTATESVGGNPCPECDCPMTAAATRTIQNDD